MLRTVDSRRHGEVGLKACNNLPKPQEARCREEGCGRLLHTLNLIPLSAFLYISTVYLARCHHYMYILLNNSHTGTDYILNFEHRMFYLGKLIIPG